MSGMQPFVDGILGYDDSYKSTEDSRKMYFCLWALKAEPTKVIRMIGSKIHTRPPCNIGELRIQQSVADVLENMKHSPFDRYKEL